MSASSPLAPAADGAREHDAGPGELADGVSVSLPA